VARPDRDSLAALLDPAPDGERAALVPALERAEHEAMEQICRGDIAREDRSVKRALFAECRAAEQPGAEPMLSDEQLVRYAVGLQRYAVRDPLWMGVDDGRLDGSALWQHLARRLPAPYDAPALFLFGWGAYRRGDGALAGIAATRAVASDPEYSAADLLLAALSQAIDPRRLPKLRASRSA
jgi:Domain of unknown function (DUF4192)